MPVTGAFIGYYLDVTCGDDCVYVDLSFRPSGASGEIFRDDPSPVVEKTSSVSLRKIPRLRCYATSLGMTNGWNDKGTIVLSCASPIHQLDYRRRADGRASTDNRDIRLCS